MATPSRDKEDANKWDGGVRVEAAGTLVVHAALSHLRREGWQPWQSLERVVDLLDSGTDHAQVRVQI